MVTVNKIESLHDQMPGMYNTRHNVIWKALIDAIGQSDQNTAELIEAVRNQFFIKTATRPYIDRLGAMHNIERPKFVGMRDPDFRKFIPIMAYAPKQVKLVIDKLLDLFFFKDSTTSYMMSSSYSPFALKDGWALEWSVDSYRSERVEFKTEEFSNISAATADEIVGAINRQAKYSYAISHEDNVTKRIYIRIFTNTVGSKGSISITGGLSNIALKFENFKSDSGNGSNTAWTVNKIGDSVVWQWTGGEDPGMSSLEVGNIVLIDLPGNEGSFIINSVDVTGRTFSYKNLLGQSAIYTQSSSNDMKFMKSYISYVYKKNMRAISWEVTPGEIIIEIPPSPPIVRRDRKGAAHINGVVGIMSVRVSDSVLELNDASKFPSSGKFVIENINEIKSNIPEVQVDGSDLETSYTFNSRLISDQDVFTYTGISGNQLTGITPSLPLISSIHKYDISTIYRISNELIVTTTATHDFKVGEWVCLRGSTEVYGTTMMGPSLVTEVINSTRFKCSNIGTAGYATGGNARVERIGLNDSGSKVILKSSLINDRSPGPFLWDENAAFVLSAGKAVLDMRIEAGATARNITIQTGSNLPDKAGELIFDFGTAKQEGPVRYFYRPSDTSISLDPSYVFQYTHIVGGNIVLLKKRGGIVFSGTGSEHSPYLTDPGQARLVLEDLVKQVKSVGFFLNFIVRYPTFYYNFLDNYNSGVNPNDTYYNETHP